MHRRWHADGRQITAPPSDPPPRAANRRGDTIDDFDDFELDQGDDCVRVAEQDPTFRATFADGRLTVLLWWPGLPRGGPMRSLLDERDRDGVTIADLTVIGQVPQREVIVRFLANGERRCAERALVRWAEQTGHRRIWFSDRVLDLDPGGVVSPATTTCSNCRAEWRDGDDRFWISVRRDGYFPNICPLCGGDLPQWHTRRRPRRTATGPNRPPHRRRAARRRNGS